MRLSKIKLSGFKSFVDPTTILLPSNLVGVVGPNGCGKSNVIDAIRWVMGESSAKNLRGDSMTDVIFNGSANRKPVGAASIELFFDNADGAIGGQYASYGEVSVRRTVSRDGLSSYFLNNVRCRRKDITGIFLGTGLGPRSYSIIEQGMISRIVEAKPEDMRAHLEEAAGISKYKERRRETENRIRHTRDNLDRLNDLREEIENQLNHLQKQAKAAERHKVLIEELRRVDGELLAIRLSTLDAETHEQRKKFEREQTEFESAVATLRKVEADIEEVRQKQIVVSDELSATQARHYSVDLEISHLEQAIEHNRSTRERQKLDLQETQNQLDALGQEIDVDEAQLRELDQNIANLAPNLDSVRLAAEASATKLEASEQELTRWRESWAQFSHELNETHRIGEVEHARIEHLESQLAQLGQRREILESERSDILLERLEDKLADQLSTEASLAQREQELNHKLQQVIQGLDNHRRQDNELGVELDGLRGQLDAARARLEALQTLQHAALGGDEEQATQWLIDNQLDKQPRLAQKLKVVNKWQLAVEAVLGDFLQAVSVNRFDSYLNRLPDGNVLLFEDDPLRYAQDSQPDRLLAQVENAGPASELLARVLTADSLEQALQIRSRLGSGESVITPAGIWLSRTWVRVSRRDSEAGGVLTRETEMRALASTIATLEKQLERAIARRDELRANIEQLELSRKELHASQTVAAKEHASAAAELAGLRNELDRSRQRALALGEDSQGIDSNINAAEEAVREARTRLTHAAEKQSQLQAREVDLKAQEHALGREIEFNRQQADQDRDHYQNLLIEVQTQRSSRASATTTLERALTQRRQLSERTQTLTGHLADSEGPLLQLQEKLQVQLEVKVTVDGELRAKHEELEGVNDALRSQEQRRSDQGRIVNEVRERVDGLRMGTREMEIRSEALQEKFAATGLELDTILKELPAEYTAEGWHARQEQIQRSLDRIGTVNLLAIEEFEEQSERARYLEAQHEDLANALDTLEKAIRKIDRETRARFQETFESVNAGLKRIFPRLFGGGHAYLTLEGEDLLNAGVTVMAQPPGKRNSSIHLLSGGEKALTAVALVFSIFELNPAPFCLLDEVDAPLDDANVGRFCDIVREMSANVQFLFITHNKVTMELASQLMGVTMGEPGVSRLVSVDIDEAVKLAG
jgi:chromosome segregation protein